MLNIRGRYKDFKITADGNFELTFEVPKAARAAMLKGIDDIRDKDIEIKADKHKEKRSLDANRYMWKLCGELADKLKLSDIDVYRHHIRLVGVKRQEKMKIKLYETMSVAWGMLGKGWMTERVDFGDDKTEGLYDFYYGSSVYNTKQMSRLIDSIVEECKLQGIETLPPDELKGLIDRWNIKEAGK